MSGIRETIAKAQNPQPAPYVYPTYVPPASKPTPHRQRSFLPDPKDLDSDAYMNDQGSLFDESGHDISDTDPFLEDETEGVKNCIEKKLVLVIPKHFIPTNTGDNSDIRAKAIEDLAMDELSSIVGYNATELYDVKLEFDELTDEEVEVVIHLGDII